LTIYVLETKRGTETAKSSGTEVYSWMERQGVVVLNYDSFFEQNLDKTLIKKEDIVVFYITIPKSKRFDDRVKAIKCKKILRTLDGYNTDGVPMRKCLLNLERLETNKIAYCHKNSNIDNFLKSTSLDFFYMPHCLDFSNKRDSFKKNVDLIISGHLGHEPYPTRTRVYNYFAKCPSEKVKVAALPHPGYEIKNSTHDIIGEKYISFLNEGWLASACRGGWRNGMVGKYLEIGKANSLPICDIPDAMPKDMQELVINVDSSIDNNMMFNSILYHLENKKILKEKTREYQSLCEKYFDQEKVVKEFIANCMEI
jgi:hypothetical protein